MTRAARRLTTATKKTKPDRSYLRPTTAIRSAAGCSESSAFSRCEPVRSGVPYRPCALIRLRFLRWYGSAPGIAYGKRLRRPAFLPMFDGWKYRLELLRVRQQVRSRCAYTHPKRGVSPAGVGSPTVAAVCCRLRMAGHCGRGFGGTLIELSSRCVAANLWFPRHSL